MKNDLKVLLDPYNYYEYFSSSVTGREIANRDLRHRFWSRFAYVHPLPPDLSARKLIASERDHRGRSISELREWEDGLLDFSISYEGGAGKLICISGFFPNRESADSCFRRLSLILPPEIPVVRDKTFITFWSQPERVGSNPEHESKLLQVPGWRELVHNYPSSVRNELERVMTLDEPRDCAAPRLLLWRGLPGTGKTWALRALTREWSNWCNFHFITDTPMFFADCRYARRLLARLGDVDYDDDRVKWNMLILEDAGEFIAMDARQQYGQALSKLLNLSDGLLGQSLKLLILLTTNEELRNLHPAITRSGRCLTNLEFTEFGAAEAREWLAAHRCAYRSLPERMTLSDLYASLGDGAAIVNTNTTSRAAVGFTAK